MVARQRSREPRASTPEQLSESWRRRAAVKAPAAHELSFWPEGDEEDFPIDLLPFGKHPLYEKQPPSVQRNVLTYAWLAYNRRTIAAEVDVANPAFELIFADRFPASDRPFLKRAVRQSIVDEHFHTLLHMQAIETTAAARGVTPISHSSSVTARGLRAAQAAAGSDWERDLLLLIFAIVSEISINAHLNVIARAEGIQPAHRRLATYHNRDEAAHARLLRDHSLHLYPALQPDERRAFEQALPIALESFVAQDFLVWSEIFAVAGVAHSHEILEDCRMYGDRRFIRDFSGLKGLVRDLDIQGRVEFDFAAAAA